jgi:hypothetical protein
MTSVVPTFCCVLVFGHLYNDVDYVEMMFDACASVYFSSFSCRF